MPNGDDPVRFQKFRQISMSVIFTNFFRQVSLTQFSALTQAMIEDNIVMVVRKAYRAKVMPRLGVLIPEDRVCEDEKVRTVLAYVELPFMEDIRSFYFSPLTNENSKPSEEQLEAVDNLIESMMDKDNEIMPQETLNPYYQHLYQCMTFRALNPGQVLPDVSDFTKSIMAQPEVFKKNSEESMKKIAKLFKLEIVAKEKFVKTGESAFGQFKKRTTDSQDVDGKS